MAPYLLFLTLVGGPDRASVEAFLRSYDAAVVANDPDWTLAHTEPTAVFRTPGLVTYREIAAHARWMSARRPPSAVEACQTTAERIEVRGERALVDFRMAIRYKKGIGHEERWRGRLVLVWRDGDWRLWRLDEQAEHAKPAQVSRTTAPGPSSARSRGSTREGVSKGPAAARGGEALGAGRLRAA